MKKGIFSYLLLLIVTFSFMPFINVAAKTERAVKNQAELLEALKDNSVDYIVLVDNINTTQKINITRPVTIDGNNHTMKYVGTFKDEKTTDNTVWDGIYILQVYKTSATIKNIKLTGGNAALLVNGSTVNLEGTIDVSGNGFGGIELAQGKGVTETVKVNLSDDIKLVNTTESKNAPLLWVPEDSKPANITMNGITKTINTGLELTLNEVASLFPINNPKTGDEINLYFITALISLIGLSTSIILIKNPKKEN